MKAPWKLNALADGIAVLSWNIARAWDVLQDPRSYSGWKRILRPLPLLEKSVPSVLHQSLVLSLCLEESAPVELIAKSSNYSCVFEGLLNFY